VRLDQLRQLAARGKLPAGLAWIADFLESGEPLVVFAEHVETHRAVLERFRGAVHILGSDSAAARRQAVDAFQQGDGPQVIVCSIKAGAQGITLTRASNVAFLELDSTPRATIKRRAPRTGSDSTTR
jgi:SWI/SNF-related matrix-associated actin-dependent regulator of chromatin subfamily A-like protein 1